MTLLTGPEALCFRVVRPSVRACVARADAFSGRLAVNLQFQRQANTLVGEARLAQTHY